MKMTNDSDEMIEGKQKYRRREIFSVLCGTPSKTTRKILRISCHLYFTLCLLCVFIGLAVGLDPQGYGNPEFCWLSVHDTLIWSFAGPIFVVVLVRIETLNV